MTDDSLLSKFTQPASGFFMNTNRTNCTNVFYNTLPTPYSLDSCNSCSTSKTSSKTFVFDLTPHHNPVRCSPRDLLMFIPHRPQHLAQSSDRAVRHLQLRILQ